MGELRMVAARVSTDGLHDFLGLPDNIKVVAVSQYMIGDEARILLESPQFREVPASERYPTGVIVLTEEDGASRLGKFCYVQYDSPRADVAHSAMCARCGVHEGQIERDGSQYCVHCHVELFGETICMAMKEGRVKRAGSTMRRQRRPHAARRARCRNDRASP